MPFNPTLVQFKPGLSMRAWRRYVCFQSYLSPIQTVRSRRTLSRAARTFNPTLVQFKPPKLRGRRSTWSTFNPTLVQFKHIDPVPLLAGSLAFNPTLVQFKPCSRSSVHSPHKAFNPTLVQFKPYQGLQAVRPLHLSILP